MNKPTVPTYTQIPNTFLDNMAGVGFPEFKLLMAICRETIGWHRDEACLSFRSLARKTGMATRSVFSAAGALEELGLVKKTLKDGVCFYSLVFDAGDPVASLATANGVLHPLQRGVASLATDPVASLATPIKKGVKKEKESPTGDSLFPSKEIQGRKKFQKPSVEETKAYGEVIGLDPGECEKFHDRYESNGWKVARVPMVDWQAALRSWKKNSEQWAAEKRGRNGHAVAVRDWTENCNGGGSL